MLRLASCKRCQHCKVAELPLQCLWDLSKINWKTLNELSSDRTPLYMSISEHSIAWKITHPDTPDYLYFSFSTKFRGGKISISAQQMQRFVRIPQPGVVVTLLVWWFTNWTSFNLANSSVTKNMQYGNRFIFLDFFAGTLLEPLIAS